MMNERRLGNNIETCSSGERSESGALQVAYRLIRRRGWPCLALTAAIERYRDYAK